MKKLLVFIAIVGALSGCTGIVSGHNYTLSDVQKAEEAYKKVKSAYLEHKGLDVNTDLDQTESK